MGEIEILKPRSDKREYKTLILPNSLQLLLISDPNTHKCAASMNVNVGYFHDPDHLPGLAHFLEHMLSYASEKYPTEQSYSKYISENGGRKNAFTTSECTNYHFDVNADGFEEALDRFAQLFIKPLISPEATIREIKAVDSEYQKNLLSDRKRMNQLNKHLSSPAEPYHKFSTGSWETLEVRPKEKDIDIRDELIKFYEEYYSANLMHLVVYAKDNLDKVESLVQNKFQDIQNTNRNSLSFHGRPCKSEHLQILVKVVPVEEGHKLKIRWPITPGIRYYKEGPCRYIKHLIGHKAEGSLFYILKKLGWATGLSARETDDWTVDYSFFQVVTDLTDAGHENMQNVVGLIFKYVQLLQNSGVCEWIFEEIAAICETTFHYQDKSPLIEYVVEISKNMKFYPPRDWLARSSLPSVYNPSTIQMILNELTLENVRIFWQSKTFEGNTDLVEPWYGTTYSLEKLSSSLIQQWMSASPDEILHLPAANVFIPKDLSLKNFTDKVTYPSLLRTSSYSRLWHKPDMLFFIPKAYVNVDFHCPYAGNSPEMKVLTDIFTRLLKDSLNEYAYDAQLAGLNYGINHTYCGFKVTIVGYNHKLKVMLDTIVDAIVNFEVREDRFAVIKETALKQYQNYMFQQPWQQATYYSSLILQDHSWPWMEQLEVLPDLKAETLSKFVPLMLSKAFLECYIAGNIEQSEAESIIERIESTFFKSSNTLCRPLFPSQHQTKRVVKLEEGKSYCYSTKVLNPNDKNSCLVHYIQVHPDEYLANVKLELIALVAKQPMFYQLRSVEQLGYIVFLSKRNICGINGLQFVIQSTAKAPSHIDHRVEAFLRQFEGELHQLSESEFQKNVSSLIESKLEKHKNLREESTFYWREITDGTFKFDRKESEITALKQLTLKELIDFFDEFVKVGATQKKTLSIRVYGSSHLSDYEVDMSSLEQSRQVHIDDVFTFRRSQPLYGSFRGGRSPTNL